MSRLQIQGVQPMNKTQIYQYIHLPINSEVTAIGGHYVVTKELKLRDNGGEIFCTIGYGILDTTCCGTGGCSYATVHGYITNWKGETTSEGLKVTYFQPIRDRNLQKSLKHQLFETEIIQQVVFI